MDPNLTQILLTIGPIAWGLVVKYHPAWAKFPNGAIPYVTVLVTLLTRLAVPTADVHNATFASVVPIATLGVGGFLGTLLGSAWQAVQNALIYEVFLRSPLKGAGLKAYRPDGTRA